jgi:hypothetical protein
MNMAARSLKSTTPHIELRLATKEDVVRIVPFLAYFFAQSRWAENLAFHSEKARDYLEYAIPPGYAVYIIALDGDEVVGVISYHTFKVFTDPMAVMDETYVLPQKAAHDATAQTPSPTDTPTQGDDAKTPGDTMANTVLAPPNYWFNQPVSTLQARPTKKGSMVTTDTGSV